MRKFNHVGQRFGRLVALAPVNHRDWTCKCNCRWATRQEQASNTRKNVFYEGKTIAWWAAELGITAPTVAWRLRRHGSVHLPALLQSKPPTC